MTTALTIGCLRWRRPRGRVVRSENGRQILNTAATASDHDDVDLGHRVKFPQGLGDGGGSRLSLNCDPAKFELDARPAPHGILNDVTFGSVSRPQNEPDALG